MGAAKGFGIAGVGIAGSMGLAAAGFNRKRPRHARQSGLSSNCCAEWNEADLVFNQLPLTE